MKSKPPGSRGTQIAGAVVAAMLAAFIIWNNVRHTPTPVVASARATIADIEATVLASGRLEASQMVSVGAQVSGQIKSLKVKLGDRVKAGTLIAEIDATMQENELRDARAALVSAEAQRSEQAAAFQQAKFSFERQKSMLNEEATSRADFESAEAALESARARIAALDAIEQSAAKFDTAQANLGYTKIRAPLDGMVVAIVAKEGQTVNAIQSAPTIVKLANLDTMTVSAEISEADVIHVRPGQTLYFTILGNPQRRYYGKLRSIEPAPASIQAETELGAAASNSSSQSSAIYYNALFEVPNKKRRAANFHVDASKRRASRGKGRDHHSICCARTA